MKQFFKYDNPFQSNDPFYHLSFLEWIIPITIVYTFIILIIIYKIRFTDNDSLDKKMRYTLGIVSSIMLISHYLLSLISESGINIYHLPLYSLTSIICVLLVFTKNKNYYFIALYLGVIGGMINMITDQVGYSYQYLRYYEFMIANGLNIIIPLYFLIVYEYFPTFKQTLKTIVILQLGVFAIIIFNLILDTNYMYLKFGANDAYDGTIISYLGEWPWYIIWIEIIGIISIFLIYFIIQLFGKKKMSNNYVNISEYSSYMSKKKNNSMFNVKNQ